MDNLAVIILAAGKGTRMKSALPKVLHGFAGRPMLGHILATVGAFKPSRTVVITGFGAEAVEEYCNTHFPGCEFVRQTEQKGTGHAVQVCEPLLGGHTGPIVILYGDVMLNMRSDVLPALMQHHAANAQGLTLLAANVANPTGFGRLFYDHGRLLNIEEKDCDDAQRKITNANPGIYAMHGPALWPLLTKLQPNNAQGELYLTDIIQFAGDAGLGVEMQGVVAERAEMGVNSRAELAAMDALWQSRKRRELMDSGVTLIGPETCFFSHDTVIGPDSVVGPSVVCEAGVKIEGGVVVRAFTHLAGCSIARGCEVGPFARLRSGTELGEEVEIGSFVVTKKAKIGKKTKAKQLNCLVDCIVGEGVNIGGGAIFANYHHFRKEKNFVEIGDGSSVGALATLVAPVKVGRKSFVGAGTVVRADVPDEALAVSKSEFVIKPGYGKK